MPQDEGPGHTLVSQVRQRVETTLSSLWSQFIDRGYSRSWNGLWNTIKLKLCYFNMKMAGIVKELHDVKIFAPMLLFEREIRKYEVQIF